MKRASHSEHLLPLGGRALPQMLVSDYQQASAMLDSLAATFRTRESQLRKLTTPSENNPLPPTKTDTGQHGRFDSRVLTIACFCLGKFRVKVQGMPVKTSGKSKAMKILKFLAQRHRPCASEVLLDTFWPESEPKSAANRLRVEMHGLRQIFATGANVAEVIVYHDGCYELNPDINFWTDAEEFETLWRQGADLEAGGHYKEAAQSYEQAARLYLGDYLEEDLYEEWTLFRRESLRDGYLYLLGKLAGWYIEQGNYGGCISYSHKMLAQDPYREDAYRMLMRCYATQGQRATALHWYDVCQANLQKGLDITPSLETTSLKNRIMASER